MNSYEVVFCRPQGDRGRIVIEAETRLDAAKEAMLRVPLDEFRQLASIKLIAEDLQAPEACRACR